MTGTTQAVTSFELEAVRRQEILLADAPRRTGAKARPDAHETNRRVARMLGAAVGALTAIVMGGGAPATRSTRT